MDRSLDNGRHDEVSDTLFNTQATWARNVSRRELPLRSNNIAFLLFHISGCMGKPLSKALCYISWRTTSILLCREVAGIRKVFGRRRYWHQLLIAWRNGIEALFGMDINSLSPAAHISTLQPIKTIDSHGIPLAWQ